MDLIYLADFTINDYYGGAEMVDKNICDRLGITVTKTNSISKIESNTHYILSNCPGLNKDLKIELIAKKNYSIFEHDYKIHPSRQPNRYPSNIFPENELLPIEVLLLKNAKNVFVQSQDHMDCYLNNRIPANYFNMSSSIWSEEELQKLDDIGRLTPYKDHRFAILNSPIPEKGTKIAVDWCNQNTIDYTLINRSTQFKFYQDLAGQPALVYLPFVKESFCRVVVEARAMHMNVITTKTYGAVKEPWYKEYMGASLIKFLLEQSKKNTEILKSKCT